MNTPNTKIRPKKLVTYQEAVDIVGVNGDHYAPNPDTVIRNGKWNPTPDEFDAYLARELELAIHNSRNWRTEDFKTSLHSPNTIAALELTRKIANGI